MKGLKKSLICALKTRKKTLTMAAAINQVKQNEEKSTVSSTCLKTVTLD